MLVKGDSGPSPRYGHSILYYKNKVSMTYGNVDQRSAMVVVVVVAAAAAAV